MSLTTPIYSNLHHIIYAWILRNNFAIHFVSLDLATICTKPSSACTIKSIIFYEMCIVNTHPTCSLLLDNCCESFRSTPFPIDFLTLICCINVLYVVCCLLICDCDCTIILSGIKLHMSMVYTCARTEIFYS